MVEQSMSGCDECSKRNLGSTVVQYPGGVVVDSTIAPWWCDDRGIGQRPRMTLFKMGAAVEIKHGPITDSTRDRIANRLAPVLAEQRRVGRSYLQANVTLAWDDAHAELLLDRLDAAVTMLLGPTFQALAEKLDDDAGYGDTVILSAHVSRIGVILRADVSADDESSSVTEKVTRELLCIDITSDVDGMNADVARIRARAVAS